MTGLLAADTIKQKDAKARSDWTRTGGSNMDKRHFGIEPELDIISEGVTLPFPPIWNIETE